MGATRSGDGWRFEFPPDLLGAFGGAFGGAVAAAALIAARAEAPGRVPGALDIQFLRALPAGTATATATPLRAGRSVTAVSVDVAGADGKLASRATVTLVDPAALDQRDTPGDAAPAVAAAQQWMNPRSVNAPIIDTLKPRVGTTADGALATTVTVPWADEGADAEAVCFAADLAVGPPVAAGMGDRWVPHPNPDISLRFVGEPVGPEPMACCRLQRIAGGVAVQTLTVYGTGGLVAVGTSMSLLMPAR